MQYIRRFLFMTLGLDSYLRVIRKSYFVIFKFGLLRKDPVYEWHYFVRNLIRKDDVVIDIGANMGYYSSIFSDLAGINGKVYSVEPVVPLIKQLKRQVKRKRNTAILPFALGNENKSKVFLSVPGGINKAGYLRHGLFSIREDQKNYRANKFTFPAVLRKGSEVFAGLSRIDYIKCDVEGYEKIILEDMESLLTKHQPMVQVEIRNDHFTSLTMFFKRMGYQAFKLERQNLNVIENLPLHKQYRFDTLFVPPHHFDRICSFIIDADINKLLPQPVKQANLQADP